MSVDSPVSLLISLAVVTFLGSIMGYCVALLRSKRRARLVVYHARAELAKSQATAANELLSTQTLLTDQRSILDKTTEQAQRALKREAALELHSQLQAQRIQTLESQVASYEDQQIRLKRDFASYKSNKSRELELARNKPDAWSGINELPVLQKRIVEPGGKRSSQPQTLKAGTSTGSRVSARNPNGLSSPLSRELEIPSLAESELPDSVDDLEFELSEPEGRGELPRG